MRIGELARRAGLAPSAIRYYERAGLLPPPPRRASGYRDYPEETLHRLGFVRAAQAVGLTIAQIREVLALRDRDEAPCAHVRALIQRRRDEFAQRIGELQALRADLDRLAERGLTLHSRDCRPADVCHLIGPAPQRP